MRAAVNAARSFRRSETEKVAGFRSLLVAAAAAILGWALAALLVSLGIRPLGSVLLGCAIAAVAAATLYARARKRRPLEAFAFAFACILLEWPVLAVLTLIIVGPGRET